MKKTLMTLMALTLLVAGITAQQAAPRDTAKASLGGHALTVEYGQPALKGRDVNTLMAKLPGDRMWRTGTDQVTTFATEAPVIVGGQKVPAGKYSVYVHFGEDNAASFVLNEVLGQPLGKIWDQAPAELANEPWPHFAYTKEIGDSEVVRVPMQKGPSDSTHDLFTFAFQEHGSDTMLTMSWGDQSWSIPLQPGSEEVDGAGNNKRGQPRRPCRWLPRSAVEGARALNGGRLYPSGS